MRGSYHEGWNQVESTLTPATVGSLAVSWSTPLTQSILGIGQPIVVGKAVFVGGLTLTRHNADTGALEWSTRVAAGAGVALTPAYAHGLVVAESTTGTVAAVNAETGRVVWRQALKAGPESSPSIWQDTVFLGRNDHSVVALSLRTGTVRWSWTSPRAIEGISSPTTNGSLVYISTLGGTRVIALDAATGTQRWARSLDSDNATRLDGFSTALLGGRLYLGDSAGAVYALNATTGATIWRVDVGAYVTGYAYVTGGVTATPSAILVTPGVDGSLLALSPTDGHVLWSRVVGTYVPDLMVAGGVAYTPVTVYGAGAGDFLDAMDLATGSLLRHVLVAPSALLQGGPAPAISAGRVYLVDQNQLIALGL